MKRLSLVLIALLVVAMLVAACGGTQTQTQAPAQKPAEAPKQAAAAPTTAPAAPTTAPAAAPKATDAPKQAAAAPTAAATSAAPAGATAAPKAAAPTPAPTRAPEEGPAGQKIGQGVAAAADVDKLDLTGKNIEITFWHVFGDTPRETAIKNIIAEFNKKYPNIKVTPVFKGNYNDIRKAGLTAIAANAVPDAIWSYANQISEYAKEETVQAMDPFMTSAKYGWGDLAGKIDQKIVNEYKYATFNNQTLSLPPAVSQEVMYYNSDWLKKLGYDKPPQTWDEFNAVCAKLKQTEPDKWCTAFRTDASGFALHVWGRGGELLTPDGKQVAFREPGLETFKLYKDWLDKGYAYQPAVAFGEQTDFGLGKTLFTFGTSTGIPFYKTSVEDAATKQPRFQWSIAPYPTVKAGDKQLVNLFGPSVAIMKTTPERSLAAWLFLKTWMEAEQQGTWATLANYYPLNKDAVSSPAIKSYLEKNPTYAKGFDFLQNAKSEPNAVGWQGVRDALFNGSVAVVTNKQTPEQSIDATVKASNDALKQ